MLIAAGFFFFGAMGLWYGVSLHRLRRRVLSWPRAPGTVIHRDVAQSTRAGKTSVAAFRYEAFVRYRYQVNGSTYTGDKLYLVGWATGSYKNRKHFLDKIPDEVSVYYNPQNPADACLFPHDLGSILLGYGVGLATCFFGFVLLLPKIVT